MNGKGEGSLRLTTAVFRADMLEENERPPYPF